ncbi:MAG: hypothetical protein LAT84_07915 [Balneolia bacterium]|nr:hypothetical protein [Balneolia bacterium]
MLNQLTRMAVLVIAFGFFFACSQSSHLDRAENLRQGDNLSEALRTANRAAVENPENAEAHLLKAEIIAEMARNNQPADRATLYRDMVESLQIARETADANQERSIRNRASELRTEKFDAENNAAQNILASGEYLDNTNRITAAAHLENARIIRADEPRIYDILFELYYEMGETDLAISALEGMYENGVAASRHVAALGFLYVQEYEFEKAVPVLYESWNDGQGLINSGRGLANALLELGRNDEAFAVLERLSRLDAQTVESKLGYGRILALNAMDTLDEISTGNSRDENEQFFDSAMTDLRAAESEFEAALVLNQDHLLANQTVGLYHRNLAIRLTNLYADFPFLSTSDREQDISDHLYQSLNHLELLSEQDPANQQVWLALGDVYEMLDMEEEAEIARTNAGAL